MGKMRVTQEYYKSVEVEADSPEEAYEKAKEKFEFSGFIKDRAYVCDKNDIITEVNPAGKEV